MALGVSDLGAALLPGAGGAASGPSLVESVIDAMRPRGTVVAQQPVETPGGPAPPTGSLGPLSGAAHPFLNARSRRILERSRGR